MAALTGKSNIVEVFGYPIGPNLSPAMHNAALTALNMDWLYLAFEVRLDKPTKAISFAFAQAQGAALTIANRAPERAEKPAEQLKSHLPQLAITSRSLADPAREPDIAPAGRFVNTTSVGMYFNEEVEHPIPAAEGRSCRTLNGGKCQSGREFRLL